MLVFFLCVIAAARVLVFGAAFPFFNNVDEQKHADLVMKYARGNVPRSLEHFSWESARYFALYGTPEYFMTPQQFKAGKFPPPLWTLPVEERDFAIKRNMAWWEEQENHESGEPPLYYAIAGAWLRLGRVCAIKDGWLLYWVRFLNIFIVAALVWVGAVAAKLFFPDQQFSRLGVPILLAVWPQSAFYSLQSDLLSPLCFGIAFVGLVKLLKAERPTLQLGLLTGFALAATCLVKSSNIPLLTVAGGVLVFKVHRFARERTLGASLVPLITLTVSAAIPIALWLVWNIHTFGDLTATESKIEFLGWTRKPIGEWVRHPIFTLHGLNEFWPELMASFWRGEFIWHGQRIASPLSDAFYWISSTVAIVLVALGLIWRTDKLTALQRQILWLGMASLAVLVLFVAVLSIAFDFGPCEYPSREHPYFTSGRLLSAAAVPFFLFYFYALNEVVSWIPWRWPRTIFFAGIVFVIVVSQSVLNWPVFSSRYNFFHLNGRP